MGRSNKPIMAGNAGFYHYGIAGVARSNVARLLLQQHCGRPLQACHEPSSITIEPRICSFRSSQPVLDDLSMRSASTPSGQG